MSGDQGSYGYDYQGHRVWRTVVGSSATVQTHYVFDEAGHLLAEHDGATGAVLREYVWLDDMPIAMIDSTGSPAECARVGRLWFRTYGTPLRRQGESVSDWPNQASRWTIECTQRRTLATYFLFR